MARMIWDLDNTIRVGKPIRVFSATGDEIRHVVKCNTVTGEVLFYLEDPDNEEQLASDEEGEPILIEGVAQAPLLTCPKDDLRLN